MFINKGIRLSILTACNSIARLINLSKGKRMRSIILAATLMYISILVTGATLVVPKVQYIEFEEPVVITKPSDSVLCEKYTDLYLTVLHRALECSEDYGPPPHTYEGCEELSRLLADYSRLRSYYCYGETEI